MYPRRPLALSVGVPAGNGSLRIKVYCAYCDDFTYYSFCGRRCYAKFESSAVIGETNNGSRHLCPSVPGGCTSCEGSGEITNTIACSHGYISTHSYCSHGFTTQHD